MAVAHVYTVAFEGVEAREVDVQVHIADGAPVFAVIGLADKAVAESRERVRAALGDESVPLRIFVGPGAILRARAKMRAGIPGETFRAPARSYRYSC